MRFDQRARRFSDADPQRWLTKQRFHRICQGGRIALRHAEAGFAIADQFGNTCHIGRNTRRAERHRLDQHRGQPIAITIIGNYARQSVDGGTGQRAGHFGNRQRAAQLNPGFKAMMCDQGFKRRPLRSFANDLAQKRSTPVGKFSARFDQRSKALLFDQTADRDDPFGSGGRRAISKVI